jgi:predicted MPP superfamily phosphohydrolase
MRALRVLFRTVVVAAVVAGLWAFVLEPASLRVRQHRLSVPHWSAGRLRIAVLADLHVGSPFNGIDKLRRIVTATNDTSADVVLLAGDFVIHGIRGGTYVPPEEIAAVLSALRAPLGVWAVLGNHDWWLDAHRVGAALEERGIRVLDDSAVRLERGGASFWLVGVSDFWEGAHDVKRALASVPEDASVLLLTHNPDVFPEVPGRVSLTIAGHTHGGQVWLPLFGRRVVPSMYGERYAAGSVIEDGRHLFVSTGLGTSILPVRFCVPPEVSLLELDESDPGR